MAREIDPHRLARDLLGRDYDDLGTDEQRVLRRVASGTFTGRDADELAQAHETLGDRLADRVAAIGGSWGFLLSFGVVLVAWVLLNSGLMRTLAIGVFDAYPFVFLNLLLSMLAALQAPIILMSQNRQSAKDRITARHDYEVNLRTQLEILRLSRRIDRLSREVAKLAAAAKPGNEREADTGKGS